MGHHNWLMPVGWRAAPPAVRWQQAKPLAEKRTGIAGNADAARNGRARLSWYAAIPLIVLLSLASWAIVLGGIGAAVHILSL